MRWTPGGVLVALLLAATLAGCVGLEGGDEPLEEQHEPDLPGDEETDQEAEDPEDPDVTRDADTGSEQDEVNRSQPIPEPEQQPYLFEGELEDAETRTHTVEVTNQTWELAGTLQRTQGDANLTLTISTHDGYDLDRIEEGESFRLFARTFQVAGHGEYALEVTASSDDATAYEIQGHTLEGPLAQAPQPEPIDPQEREDPEVTVAIVDSGINLYHEAFRSDREHGVDAVDATTGEPARDAQLTLGGAYTDNLGRDDATWRGLQAGQLYRFPGTNALGISLNHGDLDDHDSIYPVLDERGHGTLVADRVLSAEPDATIVAIEVTTARFSDIAQGIAWAAEQPWIDVVSVSMGNIANTPVHREPMFDDGDLEQALPRASHAVVQSGKVYVNSAGNDPTLSTTDHTSGPPWAVAVSGVDTDTRGRTLLGSNAPDFVSNFTSEGAAQGSTDGQRWGHGTSYAAPTVAGSFAHTILQLRETTGQTGPSDGLLVDAPGLRVSNHDLREAFNQSAEYWETAEYDPSETQKERLSGTLVSASGPIAPGPWFQMGWGYVDEHAAETAAQILQGIETSRKTQEAQAYMDAQHAARQTFWDAYGDP